MFVIPLGLILLRKSNVIILRVYRLLCKSKWPSNKGLVIFLFVIFISFLLYKNHWIEDSRSHWAELVSNRLKQYPSLLNHPHTATEYNHTSSTLSPKQAKLGQLPTWLELKWENKQWLFKQTPIYRSYWASVTVKDDYTTNFFSPSGIQLLDRLLWKCKTKKVSCDICTCSDDLNVKRTLSSNFPNNTVEPTPSVALHIQAQIQDDF